jgi:2-polyprenyl-6-hydroxyphenyl methylase/3-demethylubiquinone-9 3-methyltransferase
MTIDNDVYDRLGERWWDEDSPLNVLHGSLTPGRFRYFRDVLRRRTPPSTDPGRALDVGCGGGFLAEEFARLGYAVTGVDPSEVSLQSARRHAEHAGLSIDYRSGWGESLPAPDGVFDVVYCCDVLEHVSDLESVLAETARVLKPAGTYFFDTINRTQVSKVLAIKVMQEWRTTRIVDVPLHDWEMFIRPRELTRALSRAGLEVQEIVGLGPRTNPVSSLLAMRAARQGRISYGELSRRLDFGRLRNKSVSYMGYATTRPGFAA